MSKSFPNTGATVIDSSADLPAASAALEGVMMFQKDTNELKICDGSLWVSVIDTDTPAGLVMIKPTSVSGTGVSLSGYKTVISNATSATINGVFSSAFTSYHILFSRMGNTTYPYNVFQLCSGGTPNAGTYGVGRITGQGTVNYASVGTTYAPFMAGGNSVTNKPNIIKMDIDGPALTGYTAFTSYGSGDYAQVEIYAGIHQVSASYDGIKIFASDNSAFVGNVVVYGWSNS